MQTVELRTEWASRMGRLLEEDAQHRRVSATPAPHTHWARMAIGMILVPVAGYVTWLVATVGGFVA